MTTISPRPFISAVIGRPGNAARGFNQTTKERTDEMTDDINENEGGGVQTDPAAGTGAFFTKNEILDFMTANPPMGDIPPADEPLDPNAPKLARGELRYMSRPEAAYILAKLATSRRINKDGVTALQMGARGLLKRHFDRQRNWAKRREAAQASRDGDAK